MKKAIFKKKDIYLYTSHTDIQTQKSIFAAVAFDPSIHYFPVIPPMRFANQFILITTSSFAPLRRARNDIFCIDCIILITRLCVHTLFGAHSIFVRETTQDYTTRMAQ
eukprot:30270_1